MDVAPTWNDSRDTELERIVAQIEHGDRAAETEFVRRFQKGIVLLARRHARPNEARVADVAQTVLMRAIERLRAGAIRDASALPAYLRTCALREVADLYSNTEARGAQDIAAVEGHVAELIARDTPEAHAARVQLVAKVLQTINAMSVARDRELLIRFYVHEESREEVCTALCIDEGHFRRVLFRARARLQNALEPIP